MRHKYPSHDAMVVNLLDHYEQSDGSGADWYDRAREHCERLDPEDPNRAAAIIAALSPQVQWSRNLRLAEALYANDGEVKDCLGLSAHKAWRLWLGDRPEDVLGRRKTWHFYRAIVGHEDAPVVDTWMGYAVGWPHNSFSPRQYERVAGALTAAGGFANMAVAPFQATVWTHVRGGGD